MIFLDTNVLVHLITNSPKNIVAAIESAFAQAAPGELVILDSVIAETCTLLEFNPRFDMERPLIAAGLNAIFGRQAITISSAAADAFEVYQQHPKLDMIDCLLAAASDHKAKNLFTFDKDLLKALD